MLASVGIYNLQIKTLSEQKCVRWLIVRHTSAASNADTTSAMLVSTAIEPAMTRDKKDRKAESIIMVANLSVQFRMAMWRC